MSRWPDGSLPHTRRLQVDQCGMAPCSFAVECTNPLPKSGKVLPRNNNARALLQRARRLKIALVLECETNSGTNHAEIVVRAIDHVPTEVVHDADMRSNPDFDASAKLADAFGV